MKKTNFDNFIDDVFATCMLHINIKEIKEFFNKATDKEIEKKIIEIYKDTIKDNNDQIIKWLEEYEVKFNESNKLITPQICVKHMKEIINNKSYEDIE